MQEALCEELGLGVPVTTWHVARDGFAEAVNLLGLVTGSLGKIALDVMIMVSTEFAEVYEPFVKGRGASLAPCRRSATRSRRELMLAAAKGVRQHAGLMLDAMIQDFERATGPWHAEWMAIPESFVLTAGALHQAKFMLGGLIVDEQADARRTSTSAAGLIVAEAVMMGLAPHIGRQQAHDVVYDACRVVNEKGGTLAEALAGRCPKCRPALDRAAIDRLTDPANYLGLAPQMVDRVLESLDRPHCTLMPASLTIGAQCSISAFCLAASAAGFCSSFGHTSWPTSRKRCCTCGSASAVDDRRVEPGDHLRRRALGHPDAVPEGGVDVRHAELVEGRHLGRRPPALGREHP